MLGSILNIVIPLIIGAFVLFVVVRSIRRLKNGAGCSGCEGCSGKTCGGKGNIY